MMTPFPASVKTLAALAALGGSVAAGRMVTQSAIPVRTLVPPLAVSPDSFGAILTVRSLPGGRVLVNDGLLKRLVVLDSSLRTVRVVLDSTVGAVNSYGPRPEAVIPYVGDSSLFVDVPSQSLVLIEPDGRVGRSLSAPSDHNFWLVSPTAAGVDRLGRVLYSGLEMIHERPRPGALGLSVQMNGGEPPTSNADSQPVLRANMETRRADTIAAVQNLAAHGGRTDSSADGSVTITTYVNPLPIGDVWTVMSDGTVAIVRGHDYHIDWVAPDGAITSTGKLPFDWKRLADDDKRRIRDSMTIAVKRADSLTAERIRAAIGGATGSDAAARVGRGGGGGDAGGPAPLFRRQTQVVPISELPDYVPPIRSAAARGDRDNNLWILPTTSAQSNAGELVYDVVNRQGVLYQRVRVPPGRSIAGFGPAGVLYLLSGDHLRGFRLERTRVADAPPSGPQTAKIVDLPPATVRTRATVGGVLGIREVSGGKVLVNDAGRRQLLLFDTTLATPVVVFDSTAGMPNSYGVRGVPLIPYVGDSSLMADLDGGPSALLVLGPNGQIAHSLALPSPDAGSFVGSMAGVDKLGRLIYVEGNRIRMPAVGTVGPQQLFVDSNPLLRADLDARRVDTIGRVSKAKGEYAKIDHTDPKKIVRTVIVNPLPSVDEWAVLTDGSVAFVRGHDYHIDWLRPDGSRTSTPKIPFDWKRLTDADKRKLIDSALAAHADQNKLAEAARNAPPPPPPLANDAGAGSAQRTAGGAGVTHAAYDAMGNLWVPLSYEVVDVKDIGDYWPAIRQGAVMADADNRLWILPATSAQSRAGELIYDVVSANGELAERVRVPSGRQVAGFGKGGVVYLLAGDKTRGFVLERTRLPN